MFYLHSLFQKVNKLLGAGAGLTADLSSSTMTPCRSDLIGHTSLTSHWLHLPCSTRILATSALPSSRAGVVTAATPPPHQTALERRSAGRSAATAAASGRAATARGTPTAAAGLAVTAKAVQTAATGPAVAARGARTAANSSQVTRAPRGLWASRLPAPSSSCPAPSTQ